MLAWRRTLATAHPELVAAMHEEWDRWLLMQRLEAPEVSRPRILVIADLSCVEDLRFQIGLAQLIALRTVRTAVALSFPTTAMARIARGQARREAWHGLVHIVDPAERAQLLEGLPADSPLALFAGPAALNPEFIGDLFVAASVGPRSAAPAVLFGRAFFGRAGDYFEWQQARGEDDEGLPGARQLHEYDSAKLGLGVTPPPPFVRNRWPKGDLAIETAAANDSAISLPRVEVGDELLVRSYREPLTSAVIERRCAPFCSPQESFKISLPATMLTTAPRIARVERYRANGTVLGTNLLLRVPPSRLQPKMLSAFLNKGGGGNRVIRAFSSGVGCRLAYAEDEPEILSDIPVVWGVLRESDRILAQAKAQDLYFFYIDHAYFDRGHGRSYRITRNRYEAGPVRKCPADRIDALDVEVLPWRKGGSEILVCPPTDYFMNAHGCSDWLETTLATLGAVTDRPIVVREKPREGETAVPLPKALASAHALVTHSSNVAIEAACLGTPVFVAPASAAAPVGRTDLSRIEEPAYPDRSEWLAHLAYNQFSFDEIADGRAWHMLLELEERELA